MHVIDLDRGTRHALPAPDNPQPGSIRLRLAVVATIAATALGAALALTVPALTSGGHGPHRVLATASGGVSGRVTWIGHDGGRHPYGLQYGQETEVAAATVVAVVTAGGQPAGCTLTVDGVLVDQQHASAPGTTALCVWTD